MQYGALVQLLPHSTCKSLFLFPFSFSFFRTWRAARERACLCRLFGRVPSCLEAVFLMEGGRHPSLQEHWFIPYHTPPNQSNPAQTPDVNIFHVALKITVRN